MHKSLILIILFSVSICVFPQNDSLPEILPEVTGKWLKNKEVEYYKDDDLFFLVNGGAELYLEYGFIDVVSATYSDTSGKKLKVELFRMEDAFSAYGIYSFKRTQRTPDEKYQYLTISQYYSMFVSGKIYGLITNTNGIPKQKLERFTLEITDLINGKAQKPLLVSKLEKIAGNTSKFVYMNGSIALNNFYIFDFGNVFNLERGVFFKDANEGVYVLQYERDGLAKEAFLKAIQKFSDKPKYTVLSESDERFIMKAKRGNYFTAELFNSYIILIQSEDKGKSGVDFSKIREALSDK